MERQKGGSDLTTDQWPARKRVLILLLILGISFLFGTKDVAKPGETPGVFSEQRLERQDLVEPALEQLFESLSPTKTAELALPSGLPQGQPQPDPNLADGVEIEEEINFLIELYTAKYEVSDQAQSLEQIVKCESQNDPGATGREGERGLAQFLFGTWLDTPQARFGWDAAYNPAVNIEAAAWMLSKGRIKEFHCAS